eukprot:IDg12777t1
MGICIPAALPYDFATLIANPTAFTSAIASAMLTMLKLDAVSVIYKSEHRTCCQTSHQKQFRQYNFFAQYFSTWMRILRVTEWEDIRTSSIIFEIPGMFSELKSGVCMISVEFIFRPSDVISYGPTLN